jgi:hypothetical protein
MNVGHFRISAVSLALAISLSQGSRLAHALSPQLTDGQKYQCALLYLQQNIEAGKATTADFKKAWSLLHRADFDYSKLTSQEKATLAKTEDVIAMDSLTVKSGGKSGNTGSSDGSKVRAGDILIYYITPEPGENEEGAAIVLKSFDPVSTRAERTLYQENEQAETNDSGWTLSADPVESERRYAKPGLYWFRPKYTACAKLLKIPAKNSDDAEGKSAQVHSDKKGKILPSAALGESKAEASSDTTGAR